MTKTRVKSPFSKRTYRDKEIIQIRREVKAIEEFIAYQRLAIV